ncbi:hypothetical protein PSQ90_07805 [Devosia rhodophyticola]|uniref:DNA-binding protein n=1 Tax=Devosia rhodophyticola TaxID=3026423 RepID=A0ABY7Z188_9HYPH|nr:hypothetical protein [Devosia rhodophyticola]WDR07312.1 hypothetical protein PSQ90_07805 [Devosia rhodophyticola]
MSGPSAARPRLRRREAAAYLLEVHGVPVAVATLAKMATVGGGPLITYFGRRPLYACSDLDSWASGKLAAPVASTSGRNVDV